MFKINDDLISTYSTFKQGNNFEHDYVKNSNLLNLTSNGIPPCLFLSVIKQKSIIIDKDCAMKLQPHQLKANFW